MFYTNYQSVPIANYFKYFYVFLEYELFFQMNKNRSCISLNSLHDGMEKFQVFNKLYLKIDIFQ